MNKSTKEQEAKKEEPKAVSKPAVVKVPVVPEGKKYNFERYVVRRNIKATHVAGMRAYVRNPEVLMTMEAWDDLFKRY